MQLFVRGNVHGEVRTGAPVLRLRIGGNLEGVVRAEGRPKLIYLLVRGHAASAVLKAIDSQQYTEFKVAVGSSDLPPGLHPLWSGRQGYVAVAGADAPPGVLR